MNCWHVLRSVDIRATVPLKINCLERKKAPLKKTKKTKNISFQVFPLAKALQFKIPSKWFRRVMGGSEIFSGQTFILAFSRTKYCFKVKNNIRFFQD